MASFYEQAFRFEYRSKKENVGQDDLTNASGTYRSSASELLHAGLFEDGATDAEFATWVTQRNPQQVKQCFES